MDLYQTTIESINSIMAEDILQPHEKVVKIKGVMEFLTNIENGLLSEKKDENKSND